MFLIKFFNSHRQEIGESASLKFLTVGLSLAHVLIYFLWSNKGPFSGEAIVCWNWFAHCQSYFQLTQAQLQWIWNIFLTLSLIGVALCLHYHTLTWSYFFQGLSFIALLFFYSFDFRLADNTILLILFINFGYLFFPQKVLFVKLITFFSYISWGLNKLNQEWMAGYWLQNNIKYNLPVKGIEWFAVLSIMIEVLVPFLLFSKRLPRFLSAVVILLTYSMTKLFIIGEILNLIEIFLMLFFLLSFFENLKKERKMRYQSHIRPQPTKGWVYVFLALFIPTQLFSSLHPPQSIPSSPLFFQKAPIPVECQHVAFLHFKNKIVELESPLKKIETEYLHCHPLLNFNMAKQLCPTDLLEDNVPKENFQGVQSYFARRLVSEERYNRIFEIKNICSPEVRFQNSRFQSKAQSKAESKTQGKTDNKTHSETTQ